MILHPFLSISVSRVVFNVPQASDKCHQVIQVKTSRIRVCVCVCVYQVCSGMKVVIVVQADEACQVV